MLFPVKHPAVNWVDGMKISRRQFIDTDNHFTDSLRDTASLFLRNYDFGLLPPFRGQRLSCDFEISERIGQVEVRLRQCSAITAGGVRIHFVPDGYDDQLVKQFAFTGEEEKDNQAQHYSIVLGANPYERVPAGTPDAGETPPRHPYAGVQYDLSILPASQVEAGEMGLNHLVIGQITRENGRVSVNGQYIPPSAAIVSHPGLIRYYERFSALLNEIQISSLRIIEKVAARDNKLTLALNIKMLCERLLDYIAQIFFSYRNMMHQQPPVMLVSCFSNMAHLFYSTLHYSGAKEKEEMLKYFYEWKDVTPGNFEDLLLRTIDVVYDHYNIHRSMEQVSECMQVLAALLNKLSSLEFIGQPKGNIVVAEEKMVEQIKVRNSWSILD
ncbi:hypothetical protein EGT74_25695 [Chitinophaga lutea]|uniref:Type VI secretion system baseplate subunit TssK n=1 Tax=Chitinophaga lutea TaxID=2488634 RepID=A0A3N4PPV4_9BACT|nr:hypothetical protein [Chitinophaga lutea]RPE05760.1 hypothetical protein EGT74_25695 [Chitinophaga lutea]